MFKVICVLSIFSVALASRNPGLLQANEKFYVSEYQLEFQQAFAACKRYGWLLATEINATETEQINAVLQSNGLATYPHWLGGFYQNDGEFNPIWMWLQSGEEFNYTNWQSGEPTGSGYNCLQKFSVSGKWQAELCSSMSYFICKKF